MNKADHIISRFILLIHQIIQTQYLDCKDHIISRIVLLIRHIIQTQHLDSKKSKKCQQQVSNTRPLYLFTPTFIFRLLKKQKNW